MVPVLISLLAMHPNMFILLSEKTFLLATSKCTTKHHFYPSFGSRSEQAVNTKISVCGFFSWLLEENESLKMIMLYFKMMLSETLK